MGMVKACKKLGDGALGWMVIPLTFSCSKGKNRGGAGKRQVGVVVGRGIKTRPTREAWVRGVWLEG